MRADGDERSDAAVAARRLSVAAGPEAGEREHERGDSQRVESREVDDEAAHEPEAPRRGPSPAASPSATTATSSTSGAPPPTTSDETMTVCSIAATKTTTAPRSTAPALIERRSVGTRTRTASSEPKSTKGSICTCWKRSVSVKPTLVTLPDQNALGIQRAETARAPARGDDLVSHLDQILLADAVENERLPRSASVPHDARRTRAQVDRGHRRLLVRQQLNAGGIRRHPGDDARPARRRDDRDR